MARAGVRLLGSMLSTASRVLVRPVGCMTEMLVPVSRSSQCTAMRCFSSEPLRPIAAGPSPPNHTHTHPHPTHTCSTIRSSALTHRPPPRASHSRTQSRTRERGAYQLHVRHPYTAISNRRVLCRCGPSWARSCNVELACEMRAAPKPGAEEPLPDPPGAFATAAAMGGGGEV